MAPAGPTELVREESRSADREARFDGADLLRCMLAAREGDRREGILLRQGFGWFRVSGAGHEALAVLARLMRPGDVLFPHYRDRALVQALGVETESLARDFLAKAASSSAGRNMPAHFSSRRRNVVSLASPTASQCLPAAGWAWAMKLARQGVLDARGIEAPCDGVVVCCLGEGSTREGEFYEAVCFAVQEALPVVFAIEDNGYCVSTPTRRHMPLRLGVFDAALFERVDARDPRATFDAAQRAFGKARRGEGPAILWCEVDRLDSHTSADDQRVYRSRAEIERAASADPIPAFAASLIESGELTPSEWETMQADARREADTVYARVLTEPDPPAVSAAEGVFGAAVEHDPIPFDAKEARESSPYVAAANASRDSLAIAEALNRVFGAGLERFPNMVLFGLDVEDPKGGVFRLTKGLSARFPGRVVNAPLSEATIVGAGVGLALSGCRPVVEVQFIDFIPMGFSQLAHQAATMRWRSNGEWTCPLVVYAAYGAYAPGGGIWHSQSNDGWWAHIPGLRVAVPSTPEDAAGLFWAAFQDPDPALILVPKSLMWTPMPARPFQTLPFGRAAVRRSGKDATLVSWGSCAPLAEEAADALDREGIRVETIDLRTLVPCDWATVENSLAKTGRLVVVHEDARTCGFGQAVVGEMGSRRAAFDLLAAPPQIVARPDVHVPFRPELEYALLPSVERVIEAVRAVAR